MIANNTGRKREQYDKLVSFVRIIVQHDAQLREQYAVGDRFCFVRDRLQGLLSGLEANMPPVVDLHEESATQRISHAAEREVYIYLYNAQGAVLRSWAALLTPHALYEHSINRPVYTTKEQVETLLRGKSNPAQHAYLTISVFESDLVQQQGKADATGKPLFRVKEGALKPGHLISLTHNGHEYVLNVRGEIVKKEERSPPQQ
jgi:hypothetical protein